MITKKHTGSNIVLIVLWMAFVALWVRVFQQTRLADVATSLGLLLGLGALYGLIVGAWVAHNISLARRRNRRRATETITIFPSHDYLGLPVEIRSNLMTEQEIQVKIVNGVKQYSPQDKSEGLENLAVVVMDGQGSVEDAQDLVSKSSLSGPGATR